MKRILAIILTLVVVMGTVSLTANAETEGYYKYIIIDGKATIMNVSTDISGNVTIPSTLGGYEVTSIGVRAFFQCTNLTSVTIPDGVTSIGKGAFLYCESITSITIPDSVTSIGDIAFGWCDSLTSATIPDGVTSIGELMFVGCEDLTSVTIPNGVTSIERGAFEFCINLTSIIIPDSVTSIGAYAFAECSALESITLTDSVTSIEMSAFSGTGYYLNEDNWENDILYIGSHLISAKYSDCDTYVVKDGTLTIADFAFYYVEELKGITIPDSVTNIGIDAFLDTEYYLNEDNWENDVLYIGSHLISAKYSICDTYIVKDSTLTIADYAFVYAEELEGITIPDSVTNIGENAFGGCVGLESMTVDSGNTVYHSSGNCIIDTENKILVAGCKNSTIPTDSTVTSIGEYAFFVNYEITSITIPDSVTSIGNRAFLECTGLTEIAIPDSVTSIGDEAFEACAELTNVTLSDSLTSLGSRAFFGCQSITSIVIPNKVTIIGNYTFSRCFSLTKIQLPVNATFIGESAFSDCTNLTDVWYVGSEEDREEICCYGYNDNLINATWHYNTCADEHSYTDCFDSTCNECGWEKTGTIGHTFDNDCDATCNECSFERETGHIYGDDDICDVCGQPMCELGDVDSDGVITDWDGVVLARYLAGWDVDISVIDALDIDGDGEITDWDGVMLDRHLAGWNIQIG